MASIIAAEVDAKDFDEKNLKMCCPYHEEDHASFVWNKKSLCFHCFGACGKNYDIIDVFMHQGNTYVEAVQRLFTLADIRYAFGEHHIQTKSQYRYPHEVICENKDLVYSYLEKRKISRETADYLDIRQDERGNVVFNYYDLNDCLTMVKYRPSRKISKGENKNWCQKDSDTSPLLFNMNRINTGQPLLICCGELDCAAAVESGWTNSVSIPLGDGNLQWVKESFDWLEQFDSIIVCPDNDESGTKFRKQVVTMLGSWRCRVAHVPERCDVEGFCKHKIKDLNELLLFCGKEAVLHMIEDAQSTPVPSVLDLSDVKANDFSEMEGVTTGIDVIDKELMKLFYSTVTIVSGQPGAGKSSLLCQLICNAMEQDVNAWLFSGELANPITKSWLNYILAGPRNVDEFQCANGDKYYKVRGGVEGKIDEFYKGKWFVYRDDWDNNLETLISSMTDVIRQYCCKLLILDNLMVIDNDTSDDELKEQTSTMKALITVAKKYDVAVVLVCHPRKMSASTSVGIYDVSGTANLVNLAHRTIAIRRVTEDEKSGEDQYSTLKPALRQYDVIVNIIKDRIRGRSSIMRGLYYDVPSRRFYSNPTEYAYQYHWDTNAYPVGLPTPYHPDDAEVFGSHIARKEAR